MTEAKLTTNTAISGGLLVAACTLVWQAAGLRSDARAEMQAQGAELKAQGVEITALRRDMGYWVEMLRSMNPDNAIPPFPGASVEER